MSLAAAAIVLASLGPLGVTASAASAEDGAACLADGSGFLSARLRGGIEADLDWRGPELECTGMARPDGRGLRLRFAGPLSGGQRLAIVFAPPLLAEGADARAVPVNVTVLDETHGAIFGTRGEQRCTLDDVSQKRLAADDPDVRLWAVHGRGFCTEPARSLDGDGALLLTRFDFLGQVAWRDESPAPTPLGPW